MFIICTKDIKAFETPASDFSIDHFTVSLGWRIDGKTLNASIQNSGRESFE